MKQKTHSEEYQPAKFTILEARPGRIQTKRFHEGGVDNSSRARNFTFEEREVSDFEDLLALISELSQSVQKVAVSGSVKEEVRHHKKIRRLAKPRNGANPTLEDLGCSWLHFDIDDVERPDHLDWGDPQALAEWTWRNICHGLPALKDLSVEGEAF